MTNGADNADNIKDLTTKTLAERFKTEDKVNRRSLARLNAVEALFELDFTSKDIPSLLARYNARPFISDETHDGLEKPDFSHVKRIIEGVLAEKELINDAISLSLSQNWRIDRIDPTLRAILRAASAELFLMPDMPKKVVISEYMKVGTAFLDDKQTDFLNAVLDNLSGRLRPDDNKSNE